MIPLAIEAKLITIVLLALMNILLLKRKRSDNDTIESYMIQGEHSHNVNSSDGKEKSDNFSVKYEYTEKFVDLNDGFEEIFNTKPNTQSKQTENLLFVKLDSRNTIEKQKEQASPKQLLSQSSYQTNNLNRSEKSAKIIQKVEDPKNESDSFASKEQIKPPHSNPKINVPSLLIPIQEETIQQEFYDIICEKKSDQNSISKSSKIAPNVEPIVSPMTQRKFNQKRFPLEPESETDSNTRKTQIKIKTKEKSPCKNHCQCCKNSQAPRQTLKRCLQDLIYSTFEQMIQKDALQQNFGHKKKKRSL